MKNYFRAAILVGILSAMLASSASVSAHETQHSPFNQKIRTVQMRLADLGYFVGYFDGVIGSKTKNAIKSFQHIHGLHANGLLTKATTKLLFLTDYMAHHYYQTSYYGADGTIGSYSGYPYNRPGHINPQTGAWVVSGNK